MNRKGEKDYSPHPDEAWSWTSAHIPFPIEWMEKRTGLSGTISGTKTGTFSIRPEGEGKLPWKWKWRPKNTTKKAPGTKPRHQHPKGYNQPRNSIPRGVRKVNKNRGFGALFSLNNLFNIYIIHFL